MFSLIKLDFNAKGIALGIWDRIVGRRKLDQTTANILFVDDEDFPIVENLKKAGWAVSAVRDVKDLSDSKLKRADVVFVDFKGVGKVLAPGEQGLGLIKAIKNQYGDSKRVILYSGYTQFSLREDTRVADNQLSKEADTYEFINMI